jgi:hypothetical protein
MPEAPKALVELHARLVERTVDRRPATAAEVARELRAYATSWPKADAGSVTAMMQRFFSAEIEARRAELNAALEVAAPARVEELRSTLDLETGFERATLTEPLILRSESPASGRRARSWRGLASGAVLLALAAGIVAVAVSRGGSGDHSVAPVSPTAAATTAAEAPSTSPVPGLPSASAAGPMTAVSAAPLATTVTRPSPARSPAGAPARTMGRPTKPAPAPGTSRPPDVDPTPF